MPSFSIMIGGAGSCTVTVCVHGPCLVASTVTVLARSRSVHDHGPCGHGRAPLGPCRATKRARHPGAGTRGPCFGDNAVASLDTGCHSSWWEGRGPRGPASSGRAGQAALQRESGPGPGKTRMARQDSGDRSGIQRPTTAVPGAPTARAGPDPDPKMRAAAAGPFAGQASARLPAPAG